MDVGPPQGMVLQPALAAFASSPHLRPRQNEAEDQTDLATSSILFNGDFPL